MNSELKAVKIDFTQNDFDNGADGLSFERIKNRMISYDLSIF